ESEHVLLVVGVILVVEEVLEPAGREGAQERLFRLDAGLRQSRAERCKVICDLLGANVGDRARTDRAFSRGGQEDKLFVEIGELNAFAGLQSHVWGFTWIQFPRREAAEAFAVVADAET